jgi:hypothetical protein
MFLSLPSLRFCRSQEFLILTGNSIESVEGLLGLDSLSKFSSNVPIQSTGNILNICPTQICVVVELVVYTPPLLEHIYLSGNRLQDHENLFRLRSLRE